MEAEYCQSCGTKLGTDAEYCSQGGTRRGAQEYDRGGPGGPPPGPPLIASPLNSGPTAALQAPQSETNACHSTLEHVKKRRTLARVFRLVVLVVGGPVVFIAAHFIDQIIRGEKLTVCCFPNNGKGAWSVHQIAVREHFSGFARGFNDPQGPEAQLGPAAEAKIDRVDTDTYKIGSYFVQLPNTLATLHQVGYEKTDYICIVKFVKPDEWRVLSLTANRSEERRVGKE